MHSFDDYKPDTLKNFPAFIEQQQLFTLQHRLLVACSGGVDSMVLCHLLQTNRFNFAIAHCNFQLRGAESDADETLVKDYGIANGIKVFVKHFDTKKFTGENKLSVQAAARQLRYAWFEELMQTDHYDYLLTAHHADDNVETVLMNFFKGTGIRGLKGILPKRDNIVRPLLFASKKEIIEYATAHQIKWREDASNASDKYTRNFFRNNIIPQVEQVIPQASQRVKDTLEHLQEATELFEQAIDMYRSKLFVHKGEEVHIPVAKFASVKPFATIAFELLKSYGFNTVSATDIKQLLKAETGRYLSGSTHRIIKNRSWLIVAPLAHAHASCIAIDEKDESVLFENGRLFIGKTGSRDISKEAATATLDAKQISFPLLLRKWKAGDYFYPLGMPKKKKVARFLIDQKLSQTEKEKTWVLVSNNRIVWVIGYRIDDRFKVKEETKTVLKIRFTGNN